MKVEISQIEKRVGESITVSFSESMDLPDLRLNEDLEGEFQVTNAGRSILVRGKIRSSTLLECSRCAEEYLFPFEIELYEEYVPEGNLQVEPEKELSAADLNIFTYDRKEIDLEEVIRQNIIASLPLQPICKKECRGLCPSCGMNLNLGQCSCAPENTERRCIQMESLNARTDGRRMLEVAELHREVLSNGKSEV